MSLFKMFRYGLFIAAIAPNFVWGRPCERLLETSPYRIRSSRLYFTARRPHIQEILDHATVFPIPDRNGQFWTVVFEHTIRDRDEGYLVQGFIDRGRYVVESVRPSHLEIEKDYFKAVARLHKMEDQKLPLAYNGFRCNSIVVQGWIEAKIWLKHKRIARDMVQLLGRAPEYVKVFDSSKTSSLYRLGIRDNSGQVMAIVVAESGRCPLILVSAYPDGYFDNSEENSHKRDRFRY